MAHYRFNAEWFEYIELHKTPTFLAMDNQVVVIDKEDLVLDIDKIQTKTERGIFTCWGHVASGEYANLWCPIYTVHRNTYLLKV